MFHIAASRVTFCEIPQVSVRPEHGKMGAVIDKLRKDQININKYHKKRCIKKYIEIYNRLQICVGFPNKYPNNFSQNHS